MDKVSPSLKSYLSVLALLISVTSHASNGPSVGQINKSLNSAWSTLLKSTNCNYSAPEDLLCIRKYHGKTITIQLFGNPVNALILFETYTAAKLILSDNHPTGPITAQETGFLIGPIHGYAYRIVNQKMSYRVEGKRQGFDRGIKVFAHSITDGDISTEAIGLNRKENWLDGKNEPWIYHWSALAKVNEALKELKNHLNKNY